MENSQSRNRNNSRRRRPINSHHNRRDNNANPNQSNYNETPQSAHSLLPPAALLQEYEYAAEGTVARLLNLVERELEHRHRYERTTHRADTLSFRIGQFAGLSLGILVILASLTLFQKGLDIPATIMVVSGFGSMIIASGIHARRGNKQFHHRRGNGRRRFNNNDRDNRDRRNQPQA